MRTRRSEQGERLRSSIGLGTHAVVSEASRPGRESALRRYKDLMQEVGVDVSGPDQVGVEDRLGRSALASEDAIRRRPAFSARRASSSSMGEVYVRVGVG